MAGGPLAGRIRERAAREARELGGVALATVLVGDDPASEVYIGHKHKAATEAGFRAVDVRLAASTTHDEVLATVAGLNADDEIDGVLVQLPLPPQVDEAKVLLTLDPAKDVDGLHPLNAGRLYLGCPTLVPATPLGIMALLAEYGVELEGARAVVLGRSAIVGKPVAQLLLSANATVTVCHSRTDDLARYTSDADVVVAAVGNPGILTVEMVKQGAAVVDVGITRTDSGLVGDVDSGVAERAGYLTPVPGGVGPLTIAMLLRNTVIAARLRRG